LGTLQHKIHEKKEIKADRQQIHNWCHKIYQSGRFNRSITSMTLAITPLLNQEMPKFKDKNAQVKGKRFNPSKKITTIT